MPFLPALRNRIRRQPLAVIGFALLAVFVIAGLTAPWLAPDSPSAIDLIHRLQAPSAAHCAGTDELGRDTISRLLWGARLSPAISVTVVAVALVARSDPEDKQDGRQSYAAGQEEEVYPADLL